ncbi:nicotinate phosphoribosyltransferase [Nowakowskiella sp. JEL0078]|nr:nicotinate phosphoribosyltransferase [Nowakowskiella sp. JEL0078]
MPSPGTLQDSPIESILDNDLYKFTMQQAVFKAYPNLIVEYKFNNRDKKSQIFNNEVFELIEHWVSQLSSLKLKPEEREWIKKNLTFFEDEYLDFLSNLTFNPKSEVKLSLSESGHLDVLVTGEWKVVILYEVFLMSLISEAYFLVVDKDWNLDSQAQLAKEKCRDLVKAGCVFSEFGTRRRRSFKTHWIVLNAMKSEYEKIISENRITPDGSSLGELTGTSNVALAKEFNLRAVGTLAHEWFMAHSVLDANKEINLATVNHNSLKKWSEIYPNEFHTALTDTFTSKVFFDTLNISIGEIYNFRQDSGDPLEWIELFLNWYKNKLIQKDADKMDLPTKSLVFSDSLNVVNCTKIQRKIDQVNKELKDEFHCKNEPIKAFYGVGTFLTNDFSKLTNVKVKSKALNMCGDRYVVKLSDSPGKHQGDPAVFKVIEAQIKANPNWA